jgi:hypothetical protein
LFDDFFFDLGDEGGEFLEAFCFFEVDILVEEVEVEEVDIEIEVEELEDCRGWAV